MTITMTLQLVAVVVGLLLYLVEMSQGDRIRNIGLVLFFVGTFALLVK